MATSFLASKDAKMIVLLKNSKIAMRSLGSKLHITILKLALLEKTIRSQKLILELDPMDTRC